MRRLCLSLNINRRSLYNNESGESRDSSCCREKCGPDSAKERRSVPVKAACVVAVGRQDQTDGERSGEMLRSCCLEDN